MKSIQNIIKYKIIIGSIFIFLLACESREWNNPFDPDCPIEIFTPTGFLARQEGDYIILTWNENNSNITEYQIELKIENGTYTIIASPGKNDTSAIYPINFSEKLYMFKLYAVAGSNKSNEVTTSIVTKPLVDIEGNEYSFISIGSQVWMTENLRVTKYNDGTPIQNVTDNSAWTQLTSGAYCWYNNDINNKATYGALYNQFAISTKKLCPIGWHVPSDAEWTTLTNFLGGENIAGGKMKSTAGWDNPNTGATNSSGFTGLSGGRRSNTGSFDDIGIVGDWWSSNPYHHMSLYYDKQNIELTAAQYRRGKSIRCIKD